MKAFKLISLVLPLFFAVAATITVSATTRYVSTQGNNTGNCSSTACRTIGYAVGQASAGDTVKVAAGT